MAQDRTLAVMTALRTALLADSEVAGIVAARVYDTAPEGAATPYMTIGQVGYVDFSTSDSDGQDIDVDIHCWDVPADRANAKDTADVRTLMAAVRRIFHDTALSVSGVNVIVCRVLRALPVIADANEIHGVVSLRVLAGHE